MAGGPDHYKFAEAYLKLAADHNEYDDEKARYCLAKAQAHATLAHAAAVVEASPFTTEKQDEWDDMFAIPHDVVRDTGAS